jgi:hypothetical protein
MRLRRLFTWVVATALVAAVPLVLDAQRGRRFFGFGGPQAGAVPYDGRWTFTRIRYNAAAFGGGWGSSAWNHDHPRADQNLPLILDSLTSVRPNLDATQILDLEDPEIFRQPILYMWEPGYWRITDTGARHLGEYLRKGGFIIFDDFEAEQWYNFEAQFQRALPDAQFLELSFTHPIFHSFFEMDVVNLPHPSEPVEPGYFAVFEDNNPAGRMMALANFNSDIAEYWEFSGTGMFPVDTTNDAYKLGVNYMVYALTR